MELTYITQWLYFIPLERLKDTNVLRFAEFHYSGSKIRENHLMPNKW